MGKTNLCIRATISATKWLPVVVTASIFGWGWYAYTIILMISTTESIVQQILCLLFFHIFYILSAWSYSRTIFTPFAKVANRFYLSPEVSEDLAKAPSEQHREEILAYIVKKNELPVSCRTYSGGIRYCEKCNMIKPDRCHHCSICRTCIPVMDHHCPWINNCVSFTNYKFFVLFLGYTITLCVFVAASTFPQFLKFWYLVDNSHTNNSTQANQNMTGTQFYTDNIPFSSKFHVLFLFCVSTMFSMGIMFLYCFHVHLLLNNRTTLESFRPPLMTYGPDRNAFNLGKKENFYRLFGRSPWMWFVPVYTTEGSGLVFDQRRQLHSADEEARQELLNSQQNDSTPKREANNTLNHVTEV